MVKIFVSGLTAAGKTTHTKLLASEYNLQYVSAFDVLLKRANINIENVSKDFWVSSASASLRSLRAKDQSIDKWVDQQMISAAATLDNVIFDSWGLPWLSSELGLRIWIESSVSSRWWKAIISQGINSNIDPDTTLREMNNKDNFTRKYFLKNYGFDLFSKHDDFDYVIDITDFITSPTVEASYKSIKNAQKILSSIVKYYIKPDGEGLDTLKYEIDKYGQKVFQKVKPLGCI